MKKAYAAFLAIIALAAAAIRIWNYYAERRHLAEAYPELEKLVAIYSVLAWKSPSQKPPFMIETNDTGYENQQGPFVCDGALFDCFTQPVTRYIAVAGETVQTRRVIPSEDISYTFVWESLFGYSLHVGIGGEQTPFYRQVAHKKECEQERSGEENGRTPDCQFTTYIVTVSGLTASGSVTFLASEGVASFLPDGSVDRRNGWVVYVGDDPEPLTVDGVKRFIQLTLRKLQIPHTDLSAAVPELEMRWMNKDRVFLAGLLSEAASMPDTMPIADFLSSRK